MECTRCAQISDKKKQRLLPIKAPKLEMKDAENRANRPKNRSHALHDLVPFEDNALEGDAMRGGSSMTRTSTPSLVTVYEVSGDHDSHELKPTWSPSPLASSATSATTAAAAAPPPRNVANGCVRAIYSITRGQAGAIS